MLLSWNLVCNLELEARLGVVFNRGRNNRLDLPTVGASLLDQANRDFEYDWHTGISNKKFHTLLTYLKGQLNLNPLTAEEIAEGAQEKVPLSKEVLLHTYDEIINVNKKSVKRQDAGNNPESYSIRRSFLMPKTAASDPIEIIRKERLINFHFYMGRNKDDGNDLHDQNHKKANEETLTDVRITIALEYNERNVSKSEATVTLVRERKRTSLPLFGVMRVDATEVDSKSQRQSHQDSEVNYEFELEMSPAVIIEGLMRKRAKDSDTYLSDNLGNFIQTIRGCAEFLNSTSTSEIVGCSNVVNIPTDLSAIEPTYVNEYIKFVSPVVPIIGDYLFSAVAQEHQQNFDACSSAAPHNPIGAEEYREATKIGLSTQDRLELDEFRRLKAL